MYITYTYKIQKGKIRVPRENQLFSNCFHCYQLNNHQINFSFICKQFFFVGTIVCNLSHHPKLLSSSIFKMENPSALNFSLFQKQSDGNSILTHNWPIIYKKRIFAIETMPVKGKISINYCAMLNHRVFQFEPCLTHLPLLLNF